MRKLGVVQRKQLLSFFCHLCELLQVLQNQVIEVVLVLGDVHEEIGEISRETDGDPEIFEEFGLDFVFEETYKIVQSQLPILLLMQILGLLITQKWCTANTKFGKSNRVLIRWQILYKDEFVGVLLIILDGMIHVKKVLG